MKAQQAVLRFSLLVLTLIGLGLTTMVLEGEAGPRPIVALAEGEGAVRSMLPPETTRLSPFFARPELDRMLLEVAKSRTANPSRLAHPYPGAICDPNLAYVLHTSDVHWWVDTTELWDCIATWLAWVESGDTQAYWHWILFEDDGTTTLASCGYVYAYDYSSDGGGCGVADWYISNNSEYECTGDESFGVGVKLYNSEYFGWGGWWWYWDQEYEGIPEFCQN